MESFIANDMYNWTNNPGIKSRRALKRDVDYIGTYLVLRYLNLYLLSIRLRNAQ